MTAISQKRGIQPSEIKVTKMWFAKIKFLFAVFVLAFFISPQPAVAVVDVITVSFSETLSPASYSGAIDPAVSDKLININNASGSSSISEMVGVTDSALVQWNSREILNSTGTDLLEGCLGTNTLSQNGNSLWFTGLTPKSMYTIYVYSQSSTNGYKTQIKYSSNVAPGSS
ncbi:hypothetical protein [Pelodictyon phaeoclathratiforme]|jgi:hypothetical protein|uniref:Uncharacterized protein n=1 Tax=Pelodictyon phaeoclathratiforme (strain DSM 5477 / BU-1) TaxID=324925 RepID=B4SDH3_PELPB|nr:hypothetical protein [Pelodictyon phaeoclathratiforme]ACF42912.1 hypothetical protein Ppha_0610 [Pelodictyon phaeoclathratiforme BU-1]MBV5328453.1 hypothetical protein [Chlorobium sp.]